MAFVHVQVAIQYETLLEAISKLDLEAKNTLLEWLEEHVAEEEDEILARDPQFQAELEQARAEVRAGEVVSLKELIDEINKE